jgi:hypothetical protein
MGTLLIDVLDSSGNRLGDGPVRDIQSVNITRELDGAGRVKIAASVSQRSIDLFRVERRVQIIHEDNDGSLRLIGQGIIELVNVDENPTGINLGIRGPDILDELRRKNTLRARVFNQATLQTVIDELIGLVPGWTADISSTIAGNTIDGRYDGASVLKALRDTVGRYGYHFRMSSDEKVVSISQFGENSGERAIKAEIITPAMIQNPKLLFVQALPQQTSTKDLVNWVIPVGAGEGTGAVSLEKSTRTSPYTIKSITGPDGTLQYYIEDTDSIATYGQIEKMLTAKQVAPLTNSDTDVINAANALYDAAAEWLQRNSNPIVTYAITVKNPKNNLLPGSKIHVNYKGQLETPSGLVDYLNIRGDFWIIKAIERVGLDQHAVDLEISNIDQKVMTTAEKIVESMESIELRDLKPDISSTTRSYVYNEEIAAADYPDPGSSAFSAIIPVEFTDATLAVQRVRFRLKTLPFRATSLGGEGSAHQHTIFSFLGGATAVTERLYTGFPASGGVSNVRLKGPAENLKSNFDDPAHTHTPKYGIHDDTVNPKEVTVLINGVDKTTELFGFTPLAPGGAALDVIADEGVLTNLFINAAGGLRQEHEIEIRCADQQGKVKATVEIFEDNQSVRIV